MRTELLMSCRAILVDALRTTTRRRGGQFRARREYEATDSTANEARGSLAGVRRGRREKSRVEIASRTLDDGESDSTGARRDLDVDLDVDLDTTTTSLVYREIADSIARA